MKKYGLLDKDSYCDKTIIILSGWDLNEADGELKGIIEEDNNDEEIIIKSITKKEIGYSLSRYDCGQDARDEGFNFWINYHTLWKKGIGKCTRFEIEWYGKK